MADVRPFQGIRYALAGKDLTEVLCPPYDVISPGLAVKLRREKMSAVHLELPSGKGAAKYRLARKIWKRWQAQGALKQDGAPSYYVCEQTFKLAGKTYKRTGFFAALGVKPSGARLVVPHERTLPKAKADRLKLIKAVRANVSPIFGVFPDPSGVVRRALEKTKRSRPASSARMAPGVGYKLWLLTDERLIANIQRTLLSKRVLIADGHHRYEVGRHYYKLTRAARADAVLAYLCPEEDKGLIVLPMHRIAKHADMTAAAERLCRVSRCRGRGPLLKKIKAAKNPYAFGFFKKDYRFAVPRASDGCRSGLGVEWLARHLLRRLDPEEISYTPFADVAVGRAREGSGTVFFVKPAGVSGIRKAVRAIGLLPPKSTYFFPKIGTGLVFKKS